MAHWHTGGLLLFAAALADRITAGSGADYPVRARARAQRKPRLSLRLSGVQLSRLAARTLRAFEFQLPPRLTRLAPMWPLPFLLHGCRKFGILQVQ